MELLLQQEARLEELKTVLSKKFDRQFGLGERNPIDLLNRLEFAIHRCAALENKIRELSRIKEEAMWDLSSGGGVSSEVEGLTRRCLDLFPPEDERRIAAEKVLSVQKLLDCATGKRENAASKLVSQYINSEVSPACEVSLGEDKDETDENTNKNQNSTPEDESKKRENLYQVKPEDFMALPESTRGRAKLEETQHTLSVIVEAFNKNARRSKDLAKSGKRNPLSMKELDALGGKCVGHTGSSVLASLRALNLINVNRDGVTLTNS